MNLFILKFFKECNNLAKWKSHTQVVILWQWTTLLHKGPLKIHWSSHSNFYQGTIYRNAQLRYTHIMYCTLWEECEQTQCPHRSWRERTKALMWYYSPKKVNISSKTYDFWFSGQYGKYNSLLFLFLPLGRFPSKMMRCPWILTS